MTKGSIGRFITLEGGEGVGKSTQIAALAERLTACGIDVVTTREPGGSIGAEKIRALLLSPDGEGWSPAAEALLFAAARSDHNDKVIRPALARGAWVLCDRYIDSTRAYQSVGTDSSGLSDGDIMTLHRIGSGGLLPDRSFLLVADGAIATARRIARDGVHAAGQGTVQSDRFEARGEDFHAAVSRKFAAIAADEPERFRVIDASVDRAVVTDALFTALADML